MFKPYRRISFRAKTLFSVGGLLFIAFSSATFLGSSASPDCPVTVNGPDRSTEGREILFRANPTNYQSYRWEVSAGEISGPRDTSSITVVNVSAGSSCKATVTARNGNCESSASHTTLVSAPLEVCVPINISCPDSVKEGTPLKITTDIARNPYALASHWEVSAGKITKGQGTDSITVDTKGLGGQTVTATVEIGGVPPDCPRTASCKTVITARAKDKD